MFGGFERRCVHGCVWCIGCSFFVLCLQMQEDEPTSFVTYERFEAKMLELLESEEYAPDAEDTLMAAFRVRCFPWCSTCGLLDFRFAVVSRRLTQTERATWKRSAWLSCSLAMLVHLSVTRKLSVSTTPNTPQCRFAVVIL
jgi:hypothetical protein